MSESLGVLHLLANHTQPKKPKNIMKTLKITGMLLGVAAFASCGGGGGLDDATKTAIADFDSSWSAAMASANSWVADAKGQVAQWDEKHAGMEADMATWDQKKKDAQAANVAVCMAVSGEGNAIIESAEASIASWTEEGAKWSDWKKKADDGDVSQEDATAGLAEWNGKLTGVNDAMASWAEQMDALVTKHQAAEDAMNAEM
jgi:hypothetical protein